MSDELDTTPYILFNKETENSLHGKYVIAHLAKRNETQVP